VKIAQGLAGIRPCWAFIHILIKSQLKFQFWGFYTLIVAPVGVKFCMEETSMANFTPIGATCRPCEKPPKSASELLKYRRFPLHAMLTVINVLFIVVIQHATPKVAKIDHTQMT